MTIVVKDVIIYLRQNKPKITLNDSNNMELMTSLGHEYSKQTREAGQSVGFNSG